MFRSSAKLLFYWHGSYYTQGSTSRDHTGFWVYGTTWLLWRWPGICSMRPSYIYTGSQGVKLFLWMYTTPSGLGWVRIQQGIGEEILKQRLAAAAHKNPGYRSEFLCATIGRGYKIGYSLSIKSWKWCNLQPIRWTVSQGWKLYKSSWKGLWLVKRILTLHTGHHVGCQKLGSFKCGCTKFKSSVGKWWNFESSSQYQHVIPGVQDIVRLTEGHGVSKWNMNSYIFVFIWVYLPETIANFLFLS